MRTHKLKKIEKKIVVSQIIGHMRTHELKKFLKKIEVSQIIGHMWTHGHMN